MKKVLSRCNWDYKEEEMNDAKQNLMLLAPSGDRRQNVVFVIVH